MIEFHLHTYERDCAVTVARLAAALPGCGIVAYKPGPWLPGDLWLGNVQIRSSLNACIDDHTVISLCCYDPDDDVYRALTCLFVAAVRDGGLPLREASLDMVATGGFASFAWPSRRTELPTGLSFRADGWYHRDARGMVLPPRLQFISLDLAREPGVVDPLAWAARMGAMLRVEEGRGYVLDGAWTEWCARRGIAADPSALPE